MEQCQETANLAGTLVRRKEEWVQAVPQWVNDEASIIGHMNDDHAHSLSAMCRRFVADECESAQMLSLYPALFPKRLSPSERIALGRVDGF